MTTKTQWLLSSLISIPSHKVLQQQLRISKISSIILKTLSMTSSQRFLQILNIPYPLLKFSPIQIWSLLLNYFICSHLDILIKQITPQQLLPIFQVDSIRIDKQYPQQTLSHKTHMFIMEKHIVIVQEDTRAHC